MVAIWEVSASVFRTSYYGDNDKSLVYEYEFITDVSTNFRNPI